MITHVDDMFWEGTEATFKKPVAWSAPIISFKKICKAVQLHKSLKKGHFQVMAKIMGCDEKSDANAEHAHNVPVCERKLFRNFCQWARLKNPQNCVSWGLVCTLANFAGGRKNGDGSTASARKMRHNVKREGTGPR